MIIDDTKIIYQGEMMKINRKNKKTKNRYFVLTDENLYYLKSSTNRKIRGVMSTKWVRVQYIREEENNEEQKCSIRFIKNMKYCDFIIKGNENLKIWSDAFSKVFIQSNFHEKFTAIKMIGKGSFARVYLVEDK